VRRFRWLLLGVNLIGLLVVVMLSSSELALLRSDHPWLSHFLSRLERMWPGGPDMDHVVLFAWLALSWRLLMPRMRWWHVALALSGLALLTEAMQFMSHGRTPLWSDVGANLIGMVLGLLLAMPFALFFGAARRADRGGSDRVA
jgi:ABC-type phosphate/phosphonate transport system permease subunit